VPALRIGQDLQIRKDCAGAGTTYELAFTIEGATFYVYDTSIKLWALYERDSPNCVLVPNDTFVWEWYDPAVDRWNELFRWPVTQNYYGYVYTYFTITNAAGWTYRVIYRGIEKRFTVLAGPSPPTSTTFFADIADYFHSIENTVIIGPVFGLIADGFDLANTWLLWVNSLAGQIPSTATVKSWILGTYTSLDTWMDAQPGKVKTWILGTYASLDAWLDAKKATVKSWILGTYTSLDTWMDAQPGKVKTWILGTYTDLASWLTAQQATIKGWILGSYTSLDTWLDAQEEKVITLVKGAVVDLLDELIDTVDDWVDDRVDAIKNIVEKIIMKL
jgi:hypothetical protein